jgi:hypothetical protein
MVRASASVYRRLFILYPRAFQQDCADDMAQVFTDLARDAHRRVGAAGVFAVWGHALADLLVTALAERGTQMDGATWQRLGGLSLMVGSCLGGAVYVIHSLVGFAFFLGVLGDVWLAVAAFLFIPGILALHRRYAASGGGWRWLGTALAVVGVLMLALGQLGFALHLGGTFTSCGHHCISINYPSGSIVGDHLYAVSQRLGTWFAVLGLSVMSVIALLRRPFNWRMGLPAVLVVSFVAFMSLPSNATANFPAALLLVQWVGAAFLLGRDLWHDAALGGNARASVTVAG